MNKENENNLMCPFCGREFDTEKALKLHIGRYELPRHSYLEAAEYTCKEQFPDIDPKVYAEYLERMNKKTAPPYYKQFISFVRMVTCVREFIPSIDFPRFFTKALPWKKKHPGVSNSKELASAVFENEEEANLLYERYMLAKNPYYGVHDSTNSPFSMDYKGYEGMSDEEKRAHINKITKRGSTDRTSTQIGYWTKKGYTEEEAKQIISERQKTFSLEKCIEKYGEEEGRKRWQARQEKWQKNYKKTNFSAISQKLFWELYEQIDFDKDDIYFATIKDGQKMEDGKNYEYVLKVGGSIIKPDFFVKKKGLIIEFDGVYWHSKNTNKKRDAERDKLIIKEGYKVYHVKEDEYVANPQKVINECIEFLKHDD